MFNVCPRCGEYCVEKTIDRSGSLAICPFCHYKHPFILQSLFIITGPSGAGKSAACLELAPLMKECVVLESDILWGTSLVTAENNNSDYRNMWLRVAKNIGQAGRPVVLCGTALPDQFETCSERRYFSTLHYLAIVCDDALLKERLQQRPQWRKSGSDVFVKHMIQFNRWLKEHATTTDPPMTLYDNTHQSIQTTTSDVAQWIRERL
jgi:predicted ABC-type ATPase